MGQTQSGSREPAKDSPSTSPRRPPVFGKPPLVARSKPRISARARLSGAYLSAEASSAEVPELLELTAKFRDAKAHVVADVLASVEAALAVVDGDAGDTAAAVREHLAAAQLRLHQEQEQEEEEGDHLARISPRLDSGRISPRLDSEEDREEEDDDGALVGSYDKSFRLDKVTHKAVLNRVAAASRVERAWLLGTYTNIDLDASNTHHALGRQNSASRMSCMASPDSPPGSRKLARMRTDERGLLTKAALASPIVSCMMDSAEDLEFNAIDFCSLPEVGSQPITVLGTHLVHACGLVFEMNLQGQLADSSTFERRFLSFLGKLDGMYKSVPYHNSAHAVNVMSMMAWILSSDCFTDCTTPLDRFMSIVAAAVHDVAHPGVTNMFLSKTMSPLAIRYNDVAILENMHVATAFQTMQADDHCNWLELLEEASLRDGISAQPRAYVRRGLISMVLATDLSKHAKHQSGLEMSLRPSARKSCVVSEDEAQRIQALDQHLFLLGAALHAADLGHACKPREQMLTWSKLVLSEFWAQGDEERRLGISISPLCDRESGRDGVPKAQLGFYRFVVQPYFHALANLIPDIEPACEELERNQDFWAAKDEEQSTFEQLFGDAVVLASSSSFPAT